MTAHFGSELPTAAVSSAASSSISECGEQLPSVCHIVLLIHTPSESLPIVAMAAIFGVNAEIRRCTLVW